MSGSGCQASWPPASIVAETASGLPMSPRSISVRASWRVPPRKMSGAHATAHAAGVGEREQLRGLGAVIASGFSE